MFEGLAKLIRSRSPIRSATRCGVLAYLAVVLGAGPGLSALHQEVSEHRHRYCPEHGRFEVVEHDERREQEADTGHGDFEGTSDAAVRTGDFGFPAAHVACALMNALASPAPTLTTPPVVFSTLVETFDLQIAPLAGFAAFASVLVTAPKTSPPFAAA